MVPAAVPGVSGAILSGAAGAGIVAVVAAVSITPSPVLTIAIVGIAGRARVHVVVLTRGWESGDVVT